MVELNNKYKIGVRRFGTINWIGFYSLYKKETLRFFNCIRSDNIRACSNGDSIFDCNIYCLG